MFIDGYIQKHKEEPGQTDGGCRLWIFKKPLYFGIYISKSEPESMKKYGSGSEPNFF
jgi:hypothetical protein